MDVISSGLFNGLTFGQAIVVILLSLGVLGAIALIIVFKVPFKFKTRGGHIFSNIKKEEDSLKEKMTIQKRDLLVIMGRISDTIKKETEIKKVDTMNMQMSFAEEKIQEVRTLLENRFLELLKGNISSKKQDGIMFNTDFRKYELIIKNGLDKIINSFRGACRANHFDEYEDNKFLSYADRKATQYIQILTDSINDGFTNSIDISIEQITRDNLLNTFPKIKEIFIKFFTNAKKVSSETSIKLLEMEFELMDFVENFIGIKISDEEKTIFIKSLTQEREREIKRKLLEKY